MRRKNFGSFLATALFFFLVCSPIWAATTITSSKGTSTEKYNPWAETPINMDIATGVAVLNGVSMPGFNFGLYARLIKPTPVYFGIEGSAFFDTVGQSGAVIPVLVGTYVEFELSSKVKPTLGVLTGPSFAVNAINGNASSFSLLFRPGVNFILDKNVGLNFQTRFGVIGSSFAVIPQLGTAIAFN